jgi:general L-amino acid transport system permease protein
VLRNIPLLLQIFFWYFGVLKQLPHPRDSWIFADSFILNIRGLYAPAPVPGDGFGLVWAALALGLVGAWGFGRWARRRQAETGRALPTGTVATGLIVGLPALAFLAAGMPLTFEYAEASRFNVRGGLRVIPELVALVLALSFYTASFIAEIVRGGILGVSWGQTEAALSLGLRRGRVLRLVVIPQALRIIIPPLTNQYLNLTKNSSLAVAIAYPDLVSVFAGTTLNQTGQAIEILGITMLVYLGLSLGTSLFMNWYNARVALVER